MVYILVLIMYYNLHNLDCIFNSTMSRIEAARVLGNFNVNAVYIIIAID